MDLTLHNLKGSMVFPELTDYYRRFMHNYGMIDISLTQILKKDWFQWNKDAFKAFELLNEKMNK